MDAITPTHSTETRVLIVDDELHARKLLAGRARAAVARPDSGRPFFHAGLRQ